MPRYYDEEKVAEAIRQGIAALSSVFKPETDTPPEPPPERPWGGYGGPQYEVEPNAEWGVVSDALRGEQPEAPALPPERPWGGYGGPQYKSEPSPPETVASEVVNP